MQEPERTGVEGPEVAKNCDDLQQSGMRIGGSHGLPQPMQSAACGPLIEYGLQQGPSRPELIVDSQPRHPRFLGDGSKREIVDAFSRAENRCRRGQDPVTGPRRCGIAASTLVGARVHVMPMPYFNIHYVY